MKNKTYAFQCTFMANHQVYIETVNGNSGKYESVPFWLTHFHDINSFGTLEDQMRIAQLSRNFGAETAWESDDEWVG